MRAQHYPEVNPDWSFIIDTIRRKKCVLFIGPQAYTSADGTSLEEQICQELDARNPEHPLIRRFYDDDGFFLFRENKFKSRVISQLRGFYSQSFPATEKVFELLAEIPVSIIVTLTPDRQLSQVFRQKGVAHQCNYYHFGQAAKPLEGSIHEIPVLYNLMGWIEEDESLILTHNDFFSYLEAVFVGGRMNLDLKSELLQASNYIFLGLPFDKWYMQLLLRVLNLHADGANFDRIAPSQNKMNNQVKTMFEEQFKIQFVEENIENFVRELHAQCARQGLLRKVRQTTDPPPTVDVVNLDAIVELVAYAETQKAFESLRAWLSALKGHGAPFTDYFTQSVLLMSRFEALEKKAMLGMTYTQEDQVERAKINFDLLTLINTIRETKTPEKA